jgi:alkylation response protein AidB-like acyl-CoA dehydrogenase
VEIEYTDEQRLLSDTLDDLLEKRYDPNARLRLLDSELGWSRDLWSQYADLGLLGLPFDPQYGGAGMGVAELAVVMECFGRALVLEPYLATVVLGGQLVARAGSAEQRAAILPRVTTGDLQLAFAHAETGSRWSLTDVSTLAEPAAEGWTLTGAKIAVAGGDVADKVVVSARTPDGEIGLFLVDGSALHRATYAFQDGLRGADLFLSDAPAEALGTTLDAAVAIESVVDVATAALCAEAVGAMERMLWLTVGYLKTRVQFGRPIGDNQALQHRAADMFVALEQARSMALLARLALAHDDLSERRRTVWAAKIQVDLSSRHIGQEAIQLHGGIGMTWEYPVGHYLKRTAVIARTFGDVDELLASVGAEGGLIPAVRDSKLR